MNEASRVTVDWQKTGSLVPAIVQDIETLQVLMLGFMNKEAIDHTYDTGKVTFYSRTKQRLWTKGETSGNFLYVDTILVDCDNDTLLIKAKPVGNTCHKGDKTCFAEQEPFSLKMLERIIVERIESETSHKSYVQSLVQKGADRIAQKVGEEGVEVAIAAVKQKNDHKEVIEESSDLLFHLMVLLSERGLSLDDVVTELSRRHNSS